MLAPPNDHNDALGICWTVLCWDCAQALGGRSREGSVYTSYEAQCDGCGQVTICTQPRDFRLKEEDVWALRDDRYHRCGKRMNDGT